MKRKNLLLFALAAVLVLTTFISSASAYFTTYADAKGGYIIHLDEGHDIEEDFSNWTKHVRIENTGSIDYYVRARAYGPTQYPLWYLYTGDWIDGGDGWFYYVPVLHGGETTSELQVQIRNVPSGEGVESDTNFDVVVVYECTPADEPLPSGWVSTGSAG